MRELKTGSQYRVLNKHLEGAFKPSISRRFLLLQSLHTTAMGGGSAENARSCFLPMPSMAISAIVMPLSGHIV